MPGEVRQQKVSSAQSPHFMGGNSNELPAILDVTPKANPRTHPNVRMEIS